MKSELNTNLLFIIIIINYSLCTSKSFMDIASEQVFTKEEYMSEAYRKEAASLNPEYYTKKGTEELSKCRDLFSTSYERCSQFNTCNICSANSGCGWCNEKKICIPVDLNSRSDEYEPKCQGDCIRVLRIDYCYKALFEPENTQEEVNFKNYPEVLSEMEENSEDNIFEKALQKSFYELRNNKNSNVIDEMKFKQKNTQPDDCPNCVVPNRDLDSPADELSEGLKFQPNHYSLNYIPNASTNKPLSVNLEAHHERLFKDFKNTSKEVFQNLLGEKINTKPVNLLEANYKSPQDKKDEMFKHLKEFIPNFEFPQFIRSDLENSIDQIKKQKMLLWLRGYSLNEKDSKTHLPINKNLNFVNEDQMRKMFLDKFYKDIVNDPYKNKNTQVYKNLLGQETLLGENIKDEKLKRLERTKKEEKIGKIGKDTFRVEVVAKESDGVKIVKSLIVEDKIFPSHLPEIKGNNTYEIVKNLKVVNSKFIHKDDMLRMVKQNNMRFKQKGLNNNQENISKSFKEISNDLKEFLNNNDI